ncbi:MAG: hypothetical protein D6729_15835 [Deltaproteobacteria bacterium]|nr:MAG: hypothetical protein D6729_15835 [Deltaproteobacteria bacterium]
MHRVRRHPAVLLLLAATAAGCGNSSGCGCAALEPLPEMPPEDQRVYDGIVTEITPSGLAFIEQNFAGIAAQFLGGALTFDLPPGGSGSCKDSGCSGQVLCKGTTPCPIAANIDSVGFSTVAPNRLHMNAQLDVSSGDIPVEFCQRVLLCLHPDCTFQIQVQDKPISLDVVLDVDPMTRAVTFRVENLQVELTGNDFRINGGLVCDIADWGFVRDFIAGFVNNELNSRIPQEVKKAIDDMSCIKCDQFASGCSGLGGPATCDTGTNYCMNDATGECVYGPMGMSGRMDVGAVTGMGPEAPMDLLIGLGQREGPAADPFIATDGGSLFLRMITATDAELSPCVPDAPPPPNTPPPRPDFSTEAAGTPYMVGIGASDRFLDAAFYDAYRSGGLCLNLSSDAVGFISSSVFSTFLSSLNSLTEGKNVPMILAIRPKASPYVDIGAGTYRDENGKKVIEDPLLTIYLPDLHMDFYALVDGRQVRLFTLKSDIALPLGLELSPNNELVPIVGELGSLVTNIEASNAEIVAEDPQVLADIIPAIIGLIEPVIGSALAPIALPDLQGFSLDVKKLGGMVPSASKPGTYEHIGLLADLSFTPSTPAPIRVDTEASLLELKLPPPEALHPTPGRPLARPSVVLNVTAYDARLHDAGWEWQYRVDGGFWSPFQTSPTLEVTAPELLLQGVHTVEVRARARDDYRTLDPTPERLEVVVDWTPPHARLEVDPASGIARVDAVDNVFDADLEYSFQIDGGGFSAWSKDAAYALPAGFTTVTAQVRDGAGNTTELTWRGPQYIHGRTQRAQAGCNCSATGAGAGVLPLLLAVALVGVRRRR